MTKSKAILPTCKCLVSKGWREALILGASYVQTHPYQNDSSVLTVDILVRDDNDIRGMIHSVYYESAMIREIVMDLSCIIGKSADQITVDDFQNIGCYASVIQRKSKKGNIYNQAIEFVSFEDYRTYILKENSDSGVDESVSDSDVADPNVYTSIETSCERKDDPSNINTVDDVPKSNKDFEHDFDFDFDDDEEDEDEEFFFDDEED